MSTRAVYWADLQIGRVVAIIDGNWYSEADNEFRVVISCSLGDSEFARAILSPEASRHKKRSRDWNGLTQQRAIFHLVYGNLTGVVHPFFWSGMKVEEVPMNCYHHGGRRSAGFCVHDIQARVKVELDDLLKLVHATGESESPARDIARVAHELFVTTRQDLTELVDLSEDE